MARQLNNWQRFQLLGIFLILMLAVTAFNPAPSNASSSCAPIVRKYGGTFYKGKVTIVQGQPSCGEARDLLWAGMRWTLIVHRQGWECRPRNIEAVFHGQKCIREDFDGNREVIQSSVPKPCPRCTGIRK